MIAHRCDHLRWLNEVCKADSLEFKVGVGREVTGPISIGNWLVVICPEISCFLLPSDFVLISILVYTLQVFVDRRPFKDIIDTCIFLDIILYEIKSIESQICIKVRKIVSPEDEDIVRATVKSLLIYVIYPSFNVFSWDGGNFLTFSIQIFIDKRRWLIHIIQDVRKNLDTVTLIFLENEFRLPREL